MLPRSVARVSLNMFCPFTRSTHVPSKPELCCAGHRLARAMSETEPRKRIRDPALGVHVRLVVLAEQVLAIIVAVWSAHDAVNVLPRGHFGIFGEARKIGGALVSEFDQDHGAVYAVVVDAR